MCTLFFYHSSCNYSPNYIPLKCSCIELTPIKFHQITISANLHSTPCIGGLSFPDSHCIPWKPSFPLFPPWKPHQNRHENPTMFIYFHTCSPWFVHFHHDLSVIFPLNPQFSPMIFPRWGDRPGVCPWWPGALDQRRHFRRNAGECLTASDGMGS